MAVQLHGGRFVCQVQVVEVGMAQVGAHRGLHVLGVHQGINVDVALQQRVVGHDVGSHAPFVDGCRRCHVVKVVLTVSERRDVGLGLKMCLGREDVCS